MLSFFRFYHRVLIFFAEKASKQSQIFSQNDLQAVRKGIYVDEMTWIDELYLLHQRCPNAVLSHDETLYCHELLDREPLLHTLTIYSGYNAHRLKVDGRCKVYTMKKELLNVGKIAVQDNDGHKIPMYDLERTICDLI